MESSRRIRSKFEEKKLGLALLEAIDAFDQIRSLVVEESEKRPCLAKEALLELYQLILTIVQKGYTDGVDQDKVLRLLATIEVDLSKIANKTQNILNTTHKIENLLFISEDKKRKGEG